MDQKRETCRKVQSAVHATMLAHPCLACGMVSTGRRLPPARAVQAPGPCRDTHVTHLGCYCCCFAQTGIQKQQSQLLCLAKKSSLGKAALSPTWKQLQGDLSHCPGFFLPGRGEQHRPTGLSRVKKLPGLSHLCGVCDLEAKKPSLTRFPNAVRIFRSTKFTQGEACQGKNLHSVSQESSKMGLT